MLAAFATPACASDVVAVLSADIPQYQECLKGIQSEFDGVVESATLESMDKTGAKLIIAVGTKALEIALANPDTKSKTLFAMILDREFYEGKAPGVTLNVSMEGMIEVLRQIVPDIRKVGVLYTDRSAQFLPEGELPDVEIIAWKVDEVKDVPVTFRRMASQIDAFVMLADPIVARGEPAKFILSEALDYGIPVAVPSEELVKIGALVSVTADYFGIGVQTARMARKMLAGETVGIQSPDQYSTALNRKTSETLGLKLPKELVEKSTVY